MTTAYDPSAHKKSWMNDAQWECAQMAADFMHGFHHVSNLQRWGTGVAIDHPGELATYDFDGLTRLVVMAHDRCIRVGVQFETQEKNFEGNRYEETSLVITFFKRHRDGEKMCQRHPTLKDAVQRLSPDRAAV